MYVDSKKEIKNFISNYWKIAKPIKCTTVNVDTFFNISDDNADINFLHNKNVDEQIRFNKIEADIEKIANDKEYLIFLFRSEGMSYNEIGKFFNQSGERMRQLYNNLIDRLPYD